MMEKKFNNKLFYFLLGAILFSGITVFAYSITAKEIPFIPENENWKVENVEEAVNDLYNYKINDIESLLYMGFEGQSAASISGFTPDSYYLCVATIRYNVTNHNVSNADVLFTSYSHSFLDGRGTAYTLYFKANSETVTFGFPGTNGFGVTCYSVRK